MAERREREELHRAAVSAARKAMPRPPELHELLARFWAKECGEDWLNLSKPEREARTDEMRRLIFVATNPHHH